MNFQMLKKAKVISFDIFDTLLVRNVPAPNDIFKIIEYVNGISNFYKRRIEAANKAARNAISGEVTLNDIYSYLSENENMELETECVYLQVNPEIKILYDWCVSNNKHIIAVSDMYLSSSFLRKVLYENGYAIKDIFVSCEEKCSKRTGNLFEVVRKKLNIKPSEIVHIGDSWKSDYLSPIKCGWKAIHYRRKSSASRSFACVVDNCPYQDYFIKLGYTVLGPLLVGFSKWLDVQINKKKIKNILFFSRDGKIIKKAYDKLFEHNTEYIYVSRQALNTATLWLHPEFDDLKTSIIVTKSFTINKFLKRVGLNPSDVKQELYETGLSFDDEFEENVFWQNDVIKKFYELIKNKVISNSQEQYKFFFEYIVSYCKENNLGVVDIGWKGTIQTKFVELLKTQIAYKDINITGFYYGIEKETNDVEGFLYKSANQTAQKTAIDAGFGLIEILFIAREGSTLKYQHANPVLDEYEALNSEEIKSLEKIHKGAMRFVDNIKKMRILDFESQPLMDACFDYFCKLVYQPNRNDLSKLGALSFKDSDITKIISGVGTINYIKNPKHLVADYHSAPWKIGFLKKNISSLIPWGYLYKLLKR